MRFFMYTNWIWIRKKIFFIRWKIKLKKKKCDKRSKKGKKFFCCFPPASAVTASWTFLSARWLLFTEVNFQAHWGSPVWKRHFQNRYNIIRSYITWLFLIKLHSYIWKYTIMLMVTFILEARIAIYRVLNALHPSSVRWW